MANDTGMAAAPRMKTDPATFEVVKNSLYAAAEEMKVVLIGSRLSVQPVSKKEYDIVVRLNRKTKTAAG